MADLKGINVNRHVENIIKGDSVLQKGLLRKIINTRALAKYISKKFSINSLDSIISAIRRFNLQAVEDEDEKILNVFKGSIVRTKNDVACITFNATSTYVFNKLSKIENISPIRSVAGSKELKIIIETPSAEKIKNTFDEKNAQEFSQNSWHHSNQLRDSHGIKKTEENLSEISIMLSEKAIQTKGVMAKIATELALENINIIELVVCPPEFLIYVKQKDIVKAHETVLRLCG